MHASFRKGPSAPPEPASAVESLTAAPHAAADAVKSIAGLSAAFTAVLGTRLPEPHLKLPEPHAFDPVAQAKPGAGGKAQKPMPVRNSAKSPRAGHK